MDDGPRAIKLLANLGLDVPESSTDIEAHWRRLWVENPAIAAADIKPPLGWVLEKEGQIVGFFCNLLLLYYYGERPVIVADASQWGLDKRHRAKILRLSNAYFNQEGADILMATTANAAAGRIFERHGSARIPQPGYDQVLYWILDGSGFARAALKRKNTSPVLTKLISMGAGPIINTGLSIGWRQPSGSVNNVDLIDVEKIDENFDELWRKKIGEKEKLLACRSAQCLRWHFGGSPNNQTTQILIQQEKQLKGYMAVRREDASEIGLKRLRIVDLFVLDDDAPTVVDLLIAAFDYGRQQGCHVLEWIGMPPNIREFALKSRPFTRQLPTWPLFYKVTDVSLRSGLKTENDWYITPYDGDTTLA